jgi:hypothetical protein
VDHENQFDGVSAECRALSGYGSDGAGHHHEERASEKRFDFGRDV